MNPLEKALQKIAADPVSMQNRLDEWRRQHRKIVFTNGCFDILHAGHFTYLMQAAALGDRLVVALNTDASVQRLKGPSRPVNPQDARALAMAALEAVDMVVLFGEDTPLEILQEIRPDVLVKGGDYRVKDIVGYDLLCSYGGTVTTLPFVDGYSTTRIIEKMQRP